MEPKKETKKDRIPSETSLDTTSESTVSDKLPLPQNINRFGNAPLSDRILSNSSYLAAEIPHKIGNWAKNIWETSTDLSNSVLHRQGALPGSWVNDRIDPEVETADQRNQGLWLLGCRYELPDNETLESKIMAAQAESMFEPQAAHSQLINSCVPNESTSQQNSPHARPTSPTNSPIQTDQQRTSMAEDTDDAQKIAEETPVNKFAVSSIWPADFYEDFTSRLWFTYRHNYPPIRPASYKTDIGWGCMLRSGQSLLANTLLIHLLGRGTF
jgi:cysteine protease ATG4